MNTNAEKARKIRSFIKKELQVKATVRTSNANIFICLQELCDISQVKDFHNGFNDSMYDEHTQECIGVFCRVHTRFLEDLIIPGEVIEIVKNLAKIYDQPQTDSFAFERSIVDALEEEHYRANDTVKKALSLYPSATWGSIANLYSFQQRKV